MFFNLILCWKGPFGSFVLVFYKKTWHYKFNN